MVPWEQCRQRIFQDFDQDEDRGRGRLRVDHGDQGNVCVCVCVCVFKVYTRLSIMVFMWQDPSAPDGGTYRCHVKNEYGESNANLNLNIEAEPEPEGDGPTFVEKPRIQSQNQGKLVIMDCKVKANPKPEIVWTHAGKIVKESSKISISIVQEKQDIYYIKLTLNDPGAEDSGLYKCNIKNALGELNANLTLNVESEFFLFNLISFTSNIQFECPSVLVIPVIKEKPKVVKIVKKRTVIVECHVLSKFTPECTWFKETKAVKADNRHKVHVEQVKEVRLFL